MVATFLAIAGSVFGIACSLETYFARRRLTALRRNCFVTNERGHRVRYANASDECRARAETTKEN